MSNIFDKQPITETSEQKPYKFVTSDINDFVAEMQTPKQAMPDSVDFTNFPTPTEEHTDSDNEPPSIKANTQVARSTASLIVTTIDTLIPEIMRTIAKEDNADAFKADDAVRSELESAFAEYVRLKGVGDLPPGVMIVVLLLVAYGTKIPMLLQLRKANIQAASDRNEIERLQAEINQLKIDRKNGESSKTDNNNREQRNG